MRRPLILLLEDHPDDAELFQCALLEGGPRCELEVHADGATAFLRKPVGYAPFLDLVRAMTGFWCSPWLVPRQEG
jgi:hypothetical protein